MKTTFLFIILLLLNIVVYAQKNETLVDSNKRWSNLMVQGPAGYPPWPMSTTFVKFDGDILIDSVLYKKVWQTTHELQFYYQLTGFIRQDPNGQVFYRTLQDTTLRLLYNFNAEVGDTLNTFGYVQMELIVETVDSVFIYDRFLKRITLSYCGQTGEQWIEGIGSLCGVMSSGAYFMVGGTFELLCYFENDTLKYSDPGYSECYYNTVAVENFTAKRLNVNLFPNPVNSFSVLSIDGPQDEDYVLDIYSVSGQHIKSFAIKDKFLIKRKEFPSGLYLYQIMNPKTEIVSGKFWVL